MKTPGANQLIRAVVTAARGTASGAVKDCLVTSRSVGDNLKRDAVKAHVARVVAHPLPYVLDPNEQKVLEDIRKTYDYYHHMDQQANHAEVIPDWLVDKFAIAGTVAECRAQIERIKKTGIQQIAIIPYSPPGGSREETIRGFAKAMS